VLTIAHPSQEVKVPMMEAAMPYGHWRDLRLYPPRTLSAQRRMTASRPSRQHPLDGTDAVDDDPD